MPFHRPIGSSKASELIHAECGVLGVTCDFFHRSELASPFSHHRSVKKTNESICNHGFIHSTSSVQGHPMSLPQFSLQPR
jgi:hypothetical protein